jgi:hypothetical protein
MVDHARLSDCHDVTVYISGKNDIAHSWGTVDVEFTLMSHQVPSQFAYY